MARIFPGKQVAVELIVRVLACLAEGLGIRATARVFEVDPNTVLQWLGEAVDQLQAFAHYFLCEIHVRQLQVDELYAVLRAMKAGDLSEDEAIRRLSQSPHWVWTAMDPETKLLLVIDVGTRTLAMAQRVLHQVARCLAPDCVPLFLSDGFKDYLASDPDPFWLLGPSRAPPSQRSRPQTAVDAAARAAVCASDQHDTSASTGQWNSPARSCRSPATTSRRPRRRVNPGHARRGGAPATESRRCSPADAGRRHRAADAVSPLLSDLYGIAEKPCLLAPTWSCAPLAELREAESIRLYRFAVTHARRPAPGGPPIFLHRGGRVVPLTTSTADAIRMFADGLAEHLISRRYDRSRVAWGCSGRCSR